MASKKFLNLIINLSIGIVASFIATVLFNLLLIRTDYSNFINFVKVIVVSKIFYVALFIVLFRLILLGYQTNQGVERVEGEKKRKVRLQSLIRKNLYTKKLIFEIHRFQHLIRNAISNSIDLPDTKDSFKLTGKEYLSSLLIQIREIVELVTGASISVHVKVFIKKDSEASISKMPIEQTYLKTLLRLPSYKEKTRVDERSIDERTKEEKFFVGTYKFNKGEDLKNWIINIKKYDEDVKLGMSLNSSYCYILGNYEHFFVSNNLVKDEKKGYYYSNSKNWKKYYKSLAVFLISPYMDTRESIPMETPIGLLIVDSPSSNIFQSNVAAKLIGYFAHRLFDFLKLYTLD